ncbi:MAG: RrF2 family transcriptional regulator [Bacillota bacterium]|jgi:Rrf2 family cysteine metabolism transcriptional repressor
MRLSTKGQYAVRAMLVLTVHQAEAPIPLRRVAQLEDISEQYLEQIFVDLRKHKLVTGVRGAAGGYRLGRPAAEITAGDILRAVEGPIAPVECVRHNQSGACERANVCVTRELWMRLRDSMSAVLDHTTLADLAQMTVQPVDKEANS